MKKQLLTGLVVGLTFACTLTSASATPYTGADIELLGSETSAQSESPVGQWYIDYYDNFFTNGQTGAWAEYTAFLDVGSWNIGLNVTNHGYIGTDGWYPFFELSFNDSPEYSLSITASDEETNFGFINIDIQTADYFTVRYTWLNDQYDGSATPIYDANLQIDSVFFDKVDSQPVPEPATLLLFGVGLTGLIGTNLRKKKQH